ncbi:hypothetical protein ABR965_22470 [Photorhabdus laumondii]
MSTPASVIKRLDHLGIIAAFCHEVRLLRIFLLGDHPITPCVAPLLTVARGCSQFSVDSVSHGAVTCLLIRSPNQPI